MALIRQGQTLLRVDGSLAGSLNCCCDTDLPYSVCGRPCAWRIENGPIDSEMGACEGNNPEGWDSVLKSGCELDEFFGYSLTTPNIDVSRSSCESSPDKFESREGWGPFCDEFLSAGTPLRYPNVFVSAPFGASGRLTAEGHTTLPDEDGTGPYVQRQLYYQWDVWITCIDAATTGWGTEETETCSLCNGKRKAALSRYFIGGYLDWSVYERRRNENGEISEGYIVFSASLDTGIYGKPFYQQEECSDKTTFTPKTQYDPPDAETPREGCVAVPDFYIAGDLAIEISAEDGVTIGQQTFSWSDVREENYAESLGPLFGWNITPEVPDALKKHDGIKFYLADACCSDEYCNELP